MRWFSIYHVYRSNRQESTIENFDDGDGFFGERIWAVKVKCPDLIFFASNGSFDLNQRRDDGRIACVQAAFGLAETGPASCAQIFTGLNRARAMGASNAGIIAVVQRVIGYIVLADVTPHHLGSPVGDGIDLDQLKLRIPFQFVSVSSRCGLLSADRSDPGS